MQLARVVFGTGGARKVPTCWRGSRGRSAARSPSACSIGALFAFYLRYIGREITLVLLAVCALLSQVGTTQQLQPLLAALAAGLVIENLAVAQGDTLRAAVQRGAPPVLVVFFVAVGASLRLDAVAAIGLSARRAVARSASRFIRLGVGGRRQARPACPRPIGTYAWTGLISQAGITLGFASVVAAEFPEWGNQLQLLLVALIAIHELIGPAPVPPRAGPRGRARCARPRVRSSSCPIASPTFTARTRRRASRCSRDRRRRRRARCPDARARRRLDRAWRRRGGSARGRRVRQGRACRPTTRRTCFVASGSRSRRSPPTTAASRTKASGRSATSSTSGPCFAVKTGRRTRTSTRGSPPPSTRSSARPKRRCSSRTTISPSWRRRCGRCGPPRGRRSSGTFPGPIRIGFASVRGVARSSPGCSPTT